MKVTSLPARGKGPLTVDATATGSTDRRKTGNKAEIDDDKLKHTPPDMSGMLNGAARFRQARPEIGHRWIDVAHADLVRDPRATVREIHDRFQWPLERTAVDGTGAWLSEQAEQRRREIRHGYRLEDDAPTPETINRACRPDPDFAAARRRVPGPLPRCSGTLRPIVLSPRPEPACGSRRRAR